MFALAVLALAVFALAVFFAVAARRFHDAVEAVVQALERRLERRRVVGLAGRIERDDRVAELLGVRRPRRRVAGALRGRDRAGVGLELRHSRAGISHALRTLGRVP